MPDDRPPERWANERAAPPAPGFVERRRAREAKKARQLEAVAAHPLLRRRSPHYLVPRALALAGLTGTARRNALDIVPTRHTLTLPALPAGLDGFRLLHVSDPHFGADPALDDAIVASVAGIAHDLCVMTGDYRYRSSGPIDTALANLARLRDALGENGPAHAPLAVLGNHDSIDMVAPMEALGVRVLLNEHVRLRRGGAVLRVAGIDDPRYYRLDDLGRALATARVDGPDTDTAPSGTPAAADGRAVRDPTADVTARASATLLLAHSPERAAEAAAAGCDVYLCGHTHGGQICLPGGRVLLRNARAPLERLSGAWRVGAMRGYTSRGLGVSVATARFGCPPELTLITLAAD